MVFPRVRCSLIQLSADGSVRLSSLAERRVRSFLVQRPLARFRARVLAAFFAAAERPAAPLLRAALLAAAERSAALRREAARLVCCDSARRVAARFGSRCSTR